MSRVLKERKMEKGMMEELLLISTYVGTRMAAADDDDDEAGGKFVKGEDFVAWLQDLQRVLRRDDGDEQNVKQTLGAWKVLETKLLPIVEDSVGDDDACRLLMKIFLLWTEPLKPKALEALAIPPVAKGPTQRRDQKENVKNKGKNKTFAASLTRKPVEEDPLACLREAATAQVKCLADARRAFAGSRKFLRIILGSFQAALAKSDRSDKDVLALETSLVLLRNLTRPLPGTGTPDVDVAARTSFDAFVAALDSELLLDCLAELGCAVTLKENNNYGLVLVEIFANLFCDGGHAPSDVAKATALNLGGGGGGGEKKHEEEENDEENDEDDDAGAVAPERGALRQALRREKLNRHLETASRHSRFGSLLQVGSKLKPAQTALTSRAALYGGADATAGLTRSNAIVKRGYAFLSDGDLDKVRSRRRKKKVDDCRGEGDDPALEFDDLDDDDDPASRLVPRGSRKDDVLRAPTTSRLGVDARRARKALGKLATKLAVLGFGELFQVAKKQLQLDVHHVTERDKHAFLGLAEFCLAWRRERAGLLCRELGVASKKAVEDREKSKAIALRWALDDDDDDVDMEDAGTKAMKVALREETFFPKAFLGLLDTFVMGMVLDDAAEALDQKKPRRLERSVGLFKEILRGLGSLRDGDRTSRKDRESLDGCKTTPPAHAQLISAGMLERVFHAGPDSTDPLPKLLRDWKPGKHTKRYARDLVELVHVTLKLLETTTDQDDDDDDPEEANVESSEDKKAARGAQMAREEKMQRRDFNLGHYILKLAMPSTMDLYGTLLEAYAENSDEMNHYVLAFLMRLSRVPASGEASSADLPKFGPPTSAKITTLEPMLYHVRYFRIFAALVADKRRSEPGLKALSKFAGDTLRHFNAHAQKNPLLYVEALFSHGGVHAAKWCERLRDQYRGDEFATRDYRVVKKDDDDQDDLDDRPQPPPRRTEREEDDDEVDFEEAMRWDDAAARRAKQKKQDAAKRSKWTHQEDATLALILADAVDNDDDRTSIDLTRLGKLPILADHHRDKTSLKRRLTHLEKLARNHDCEGPLPAKLRALADDLKANKKRKRKQKSSKEDDDFINDDDDDEPADDDLLPPAPDDDDDMEEEHHEEEHHVTKVTEEKALQDDEDDRWNDRRKFHKPSAVLPEKRGRLGLSAASDDDSDLDDVPAVTTHESDPAASKKRRKIIDDDDDDDDDA